jgi:hypothetical protein
VCDLDSHASGGYIELNEDSFSSALLKRGCRGTISNGWRLVLVSLVRRVKP